MAEIRHIIRGDGKKVVEVFITAEELMKALKQQDTEAFSKVNTNWDEYCLTFEEE